MQHDRLRLARTWLQNARNDLDLTETIAERFPARACFHAQQSSELGLKAALVAVADDHPRTPVGGDLVLELRGVGVAVHEDVAAAANALDLYYASSRYPDALAGADPLRVISTGDAHRAVERAHLVFSFASSVVDAQPAEPA